MKWFVAISYGKGVILCEKYDSLNGNYYVKNTTLLTGTTLAH